MKTNVYFLNFYKILIMCLTLFLSGSHIHSLRMRIVEDSDIVIKFTDKPDLEGNMQNLTNKMQIRMKFLKNKLILDSKGNSTIDNTVYYQNTTKLNYSLIKIEYIPDEGKYIERQRIIKFYITSDKGCHVDINDTIQYQTSGLRSPIEHVVTNDIENHGYKVSPKGVYSNDVDVQYFGFSQAIKTFSTYFTPKNKILPSVTSDIDSNTTSTTDKAEKNDFTTIEYIYQAKNLIRSFSDFRNEASYENITYNYNIMSWFLKNENDNLEDVKIKLEYYFDIGNSFADELTNFTIPMHKKVFSYQNPNSNTGSNKTIVKFENVHDLILKYNDSLYFEAKIPLYFENCKNYKLNFLVVLTGFLFVVFFGFVAYKSISLILSQEKE